MRWKQEGKKRLPWKMNEKSIDKTVPEVFYSIDFWKNVNKLIPEKGYLIFNAAVSQPRNPQLQRVTTQLKRSFKIQEHTKVERSNTLIIGLCHQLHLVFVKRSGGYIIGSLKKKKCFLSK